MSEEAERALVQEFDRMRGRMLGYFESLGMPDKQEQGAKQTFKSLSYDSQARLAELISSSTSP